jgi:hypothetical protein
MSHQTAGVTYPNSDLMGLAQVPPPRLGNLSSSPVANLPGAQGGPRPWNPMEMGARNPMASEADAGLGYPNGPGFATASNRDALQSNNTMNQGGNQRKRKADDIMDPSDSNAAGRKRRSFASGGTQDPSTLESLPG